MAKKKRGKQARKDDSKMFAWIAAFFSIIGFVIALLTKRNNKYVMFYAEQSLMVFIASVIVWAASIAIGWIPIIGIIIISVARIIVFVLWLLSWIYALSGKTKEVPIVGRYARKISLS